MPGPTARSESEPVVLMESETARDLAAAFREFARCFALDELQDLQMVNVLRAVMTQPPGGIQVAAPVDPVRLRITRDYDVLRGLQRRPGAPVSLYMKRDEKNQILIGDAIPDAAACAVVQAVGKTELVQLDDLSSPNVLPLRRIAPEEPVVRVELVDPEGRLVAFGPYLPAVPKPVG